MSWTKRKERRQRVSYNKSRRELVPAELKAELKECGAGQLMHWPEWRDWKQAGGYRNTAWFD